MKDYVSRDIENLELVWSFYIDILHKNCIMQLMSRISLQFELISEQ